MKTIIKEGKREFIGRCKQCGCEFKYELADISFGSVQCPFCYNSVLHENQIEGAHDVIQDNQLCPYPYPTNVPSFGTYV